MGRCYRCRRSNLLLQMSLQQVFQGSRVMRSLGRWVNAVTASAALAMASAGGVAAGGSVHTGAGVARRAAYHERRAEDRAHLQEVNVEKLLANESRDDVVVRVAAVSIVLDTEGPNYVPEVRRATKKQRRARQQQEAREEQATAHPTQYLPATVQMSYT